MVHAHCAQETQDGNKECAGVRLNSIMGRLVEALGAEGRRWLVEQPGFAGAEARRHDGRRTLLGWRWRERWESEWRAEYLESETNCVSRSVEAGVRVRGGR